MTKEEKIQTIVNVLFENTTSEQLPLEKCYELAEKIVEKFRPKWIDMNWWSLLINKNREQEIASLYQRTGEYGRRSRIAEPKHFRP